MGHLNPRLNVADRLIGRYGVGKIQSLSFDNGFTREEELKKFGGFLSDTN
jgi:hypothetical protein